MKHQLVMLTRGDDLLSASGYFIYLLYNNVRQLFSFEY